MRTWGPNDRTRIFKEIVSRQPLDHSKCDQCHYHLNATAVRCMTCKKHFCYECDEKFHLTMPFHRRLLCSSKTLKILQPEEFLDSEDSIIKRGMGINFNHSTRDKSLVLYCLQVFYILFKDVCVPCFVPSNCFNLNCYGSISLVPNLQQSIVVVNEQGKNSNFVPIKT